MHADNASTVLFAACAECYGRIYAGAPVDKASYTEWCEWQCIYEASDGQNLSAEAPSLGALMQKYTLSPCEYKIKIS